MSIEKVFLVAETRNEAEQLLMDQSKKDLNATALFSQKRWPLTLELCAGGLMD